MKCRRSFERIYEPAILLLLFKKPSYGYELKSKLNSIFNCDVNIGNLYRCLSFLEKKRFIKRRVEQSFDGPNRKICFITSRGRDYLDSWIDFLKKEKQVISSILSAYEKT